MERIDFCDVYKDSHVCDMITMDKQNGMLSHAYLLSSGDDEYNKYLSRMIAKHIVCGHVLDQECSICKRINEGSYTDVISVPIKNKTILVEEINHVVTESSISPLENEYKVIIINNIDTSATLVQNKLLKTLEEPPKNVVFIINTTNIGGVLQTIKSRCKQVTVNALDEHKIRLILTALHKGVNDSIIYGSDGNITKAIKLSEDRDYLEFRQVAVDVLTKLRKSGEVLRYATLVLKFKDRLSEIFSILTDVLSDISKAINGEDNIKNKDVMVDIMNAKSLYCNKSVYYTLLKVDEAYKKYLGQANVNAVVDKLLLDILEMRYKWLS